MEKQVKESLLSDIKKTGCCALHSSFSAAQLGLGTFL